MFLKGISQDEFPDNGVGRRSNGSFRMRTMTVSEGSPTHSPRRVVPYFYRYFGSIVSKTTRIVLKKRLFLIHGLGECEGVGEDSGRRWSVRHSSRIMNLLECVFILEHCTALRWRVAHLG